MTKQILIVEHDLTASQLYGEWLKDMGYHVCTVRDGGHAMQVLRNQAIDGLILDLQVPVMDGLTMLTQLRQRYADIPVIVLASVEMTDVLLEALESGAHDYLTKPVSHHLFKQKCRRVFFQKWGQPNNHSGVLGEGDEPQKPLSGKPQEDKK